MPPFIREYGAILLVYVAVLGAFVFTFSVSEQSRDQFCTTVERAHQTDVRQLENTYEYLVSLPREKLERPDELTTAILRGLQSQEERAQTDPAPPICDGGSVFHGELGEPEPDPRVPKRPAELAGIEYRAP